MAEPRLNPTICKEFVDNSMFHNTAITNESGRRKVNEQWPHELHSFRIQYVGKWKSTEEVKVERFRELLAFWKKMRGNSRCFRFKNWSDYKDDGKGRVIEVDGVYRLVKDYHESGDDDTYTVNIYKPVLGTIQLLGDAVFGTVDYETGIGTGISSPGVWVGEFDLWMHFAEENLGALSITPGGLFNWNGLSVMEELLET